MKIVKLGLISVVILFIVMLLLSLLLPSHIRISRATDISADRNRVLPFIASIPEWQQWNEYIKRYHNTVTEPEMLKADEIGIFMIGKSDTLITTEWVPPAGEKFAAGFAIIDQRAQTGVTTVQWYFDFHIAWYPWQKFQSIVYDQQFGPLMEKSLANLKRIAEQH